MEMPTTADSPSESTPDNSTATLRYMLGAIRAHLDMDVAFISEFRRGQRVFRFVDSKGESTPIHVGDADPLEDSYCQRVVDGRLPKLIPDASQNPEAMTLKATMEVPVGTHLSVPIHLDDGYLYGTLCCFSYEPNPALREREIALLQLLSEFAGKELSRDIVPIRFREQAKDRIETILAGKTFDLVYQPIYHVTENRTVGFEVLSRFPPEVYRSPDACFKEAALIGLGEEVEMLVIEKAVASLDQFPEDIYLTLNSSPDHIISGAVERAIGEVAPGRVMVEVTEHAYIPDYMALRDSLRSMKEKGIGFAVDDAGAGYSSFNHILELKPDVIKLDMRLTRHINKDTRRRALAAGLIGFARASGSRIVAEGVETIKELNTLRDLGVNKVQGYYIGRPTDLAGVDRFLHDFALKTLS